MNLLKIIHSVFRRHKWTLVKGSMQPVGKTIHWDGDITTEYKKDFSCSCGKQKTERGFILPRCLEDSPWFP